MHIVLQMFFSQFIKETQKRAYEKKTIQREVIELFYYNYLGQC